MSTEKDTTQTEQTPADKKAAKTGLTMRESEALLSGAVMTGLVAMVVGAATADPLQPILHPMKDFHPISDVDTQRLADDIAQNPAKQARLMEIRSFVERLSQEVQESPYGHRHNGGRSR